MSEVDVLEALLSLPAGYGADLFGGLLYARSLEDGSFAVGSDEEGWEEVHPTARKVAERLVEARMVRGLGIDFEFNEAWTTTLEAGGAPTRRSG